MEVAMRYRTQGSLPISAQHKTQYIPRIPEEPAPSRRGKAKQEAPSLCRQSDEDQREQESIPKIQASLIPPAPALATATALTPKSEPPRFRIPAHDPSKAIIETSPYYIYFKIVTTKEAQDKDLKSVLNELTIVDEDLPKTAKYRHYKAYTQ